MTNDDRPAQETQIPYEFTDNLAYLLRVAQEAAFRSFKLQVENAALKPGWYAILTFLMDNPGATPSELSSVCARDRSTLSFTLKGLVNAKLVQKVPNPQDQRSYRLVLTESGREAQRRMHEIAVQHEVHLDKIVGSDKNQLIKILQNIIKNI